MLKRKDDGLTFAFINYATIEEAEKSISMNHRKKVGSKFISVKYAKAREDRPRR